MVKQGVSNAPYDKTRSGLVVGYEVNTNKYTIMVDGVQYNNIPIVNGLMAKLNDVVRVKMPTNNTSQMYICDVCCMDEVVFKQSPLLYLDVDIDPITGLAVSGSDKDLYNVVVALGWANEVIV